MDLGFQSPLCGREVTRARFVLRSKGLLCLFLLWTVSCSWHQNCGSHYCELSLACPNWRMSLEAHEAQPFHMRLGFGTGRLHKGVMCSWAHPHEALTSQAGLCVGKRLHGILVTTGRFFRKWVVFKKCGHFSFWWHASWTATLKLKCSHRRVSIKVASPSDHSCVPCGSRSRAEL